MISVVFKFSRYAFWVWGVAMGSGRRGEVICCDPESYGRIFIYDALDISIESTRELIILAVVLVLAIFSLAGLIGFLFFLLVIGGVFFLNLKRSPRMKEKEGSGIIYDEDTTILGDITCREITLLLKTLDNLSMAPDIAIRILSDGSRRSMIQGCIEKIGRVDVDLYYEIRDILDDVLSSMDMEALERKYMRAEAFRRWISTTYRFLVYILCVVLLGVSLWNILIEPTETSILIIRISLYAGFFVVFHIVCSPIIYYLMTRGLQRYVDMRTIRSRNFRRKIIGTTERLIILIATQAERLYALDLKRPYRLGRYIRRPKPRSHPEFTILWDSKRIG